MALQDVLQRLAVNGPEQQAIKAGEIDAVVDYASSNVILLPLARRALREVAIRARAANQGATNRDSIANHLLAALPRAEYRELLAGGLEPVWLRVGEVLQEPGAPIRYVYFPVGCVISLLTRVTDHPDLGIGLVGREGMVGIPLALGVHVSSGRALVQSSGTAMRMKADAFGGAILRSMLLQQALYRYKHALVGQIGQSVACTHFHQVQPRLACYLLMTADHAKSTEIRLTQDFLADMLGVHRPALNLAAGALEKEGLIKCGRGKMTILDRKRLGAASCECYKIIKRMYASMYSHG